jgi:hypothetical protein
MELRHQLEAVKIMRYSNKTECGLPEYIVDQIEKLG